MPTPGASQPTKRQQQGAVSRQEILDAASRLMSANGYEATSMSDLARESGLPPSSIYWHFSSKRGVLEAVMERGARRFFDDLRAPAEFASDEPHLVIGPALQRASRVIGEHPEFLRLYLLLLATADPAPAGHDPMLHSVRQEGRATLHELLVVAYLKSGKRTATRVADRLVDFAQGIFDGAFLAVQHDPRLSHAALMDQMAAAVVALGNDLVTRD